MDSSGVVFEKTGLGLRISLTAEGRVELAELRIAQEDSRTARWMHAIGDTEVFYDLVEWWMCNGWELLSPEQIGALTSNPYMLSDSVMYDEDLGEIVYVDTIYAYDNYQVADPLDALERDGFVEFTAHRN